MKNIHLKDNWEGYILSEATLKEEHLLKNFIHFFNKENVKQETKHNTNIDIYNLLDESKRILRLLELTDQLNYEEEYNEWRYESSHILDKLFDCMNEIAPTGCYFGSKEGDLALFGFWSIHSEAI